MLSSVVILLVGVTIASSNYLDSMLADVDPRFLRWELENEETNDAREYQEILGDDWNPGYLQGVGDYVPLEEEYAPFEKLQTPAPTQPRAEEKPESSKLMTYQSINGGDEKIKADPKEAKSDRGLPAYCNPPNPCPKGYTAEDNCIEDYENSAANNRGFNGRQECECDQEHMFECPAKAGDLDSKDSLDGDMSSMNMGGSFFGGEKRRSLVAKKSPGMYGRQKRMAEVFRGGFQQNGDRLMKRVAKKQPSA